MTDWFDKFARLATLGERVLALTENVKNLAKQVDDHQGRLIRLETIIEITRPSDGAVLRISPAKD